MKCPACGAYYNERFETCPACGYPSPSKDDPNSIPTPICGSGGKKWLVLGALAGASAIAGSAFLFANLFKKKRK